jgi:DNA-binding PadR family transcriptional regulator
VSPVFRHGRLRLYLLKLLDESPRHGYEVIRLLQDRFMGVYSPSPGTIYPRLARLEEEGLVTHDEADGRKVYRITDKGREELRNRSDDLSELEDEITASVRDIAREVTEDVRETVRNLREELTFAARDMHRRGTAPRGTRAPRGNGAPRRRETHAASAWDEALRDQAQPDQAQPQQAQHEEAHHDAAQHDAAQHEEPRHEEARHEEARHERAGHEKAGAGPGWRGWPPGGAGWADPGTYRDLEHLARRFTRELRAAATQAQAVSEDAVGDLRTILDDALDRIKAEVFGKPDAPRPGAPRPDAPPADVPSRADAPRGDDAGPGGPR